MTGPTGLERILGDAVAEARALAPAAAEQQDDLFAEPMSSEEMVAAREALGPNASHLAVLEEARSRRGGRRKGQLNRNTRDLVEYLSQFGPDPAVAAMRIIGETEEMMIQRSANASDGKRRMTFAEAQAARMRMIELMTPYFHGKKPVQVDMSFSGIGDLVLASFGGAAAARSSDIVDADFLPLPDGGDTGKGPDE